jgi:hypothetical protein
MLHRQLRQSTKLFNLSTNLHSITQILEAALSKNRKHNIISFGSQADRCNVLFCTLLSLTIFIWKGLKKIFLKSVLLVLSVTVSSKKHCLNMMIWLPKTAIKTLFFPNPSLEWWKIPHSLSIWEKKALKISYQR